ncbi:MAG: hypothetical protein NTY65_07160 [Planctomycetota bacterium]|nr:hypothetical protein [Planctomycetota bacterium]
MNRFLVSTTSPSCCAPQPQGSCGCGGGARQPVPEADLGLSCGNPVAFSHVLAGAASSVTILAVK